VSGRNLLCESGPSDLTYQLHDRGVLVTACGRIRMHRRRVNISTVLAGQRLGIKEVDDGIWIVSFLHYDLGFIDLEQKTLQPLDNPFGTGLSPHVLGTFRYLCRRSTHCCNWCRVRDSHRDTHNPQKSMTFRDQQPAIVTPVLDSNSSVCSGDSTTSAVRSRME
jgi:hypothetical protein